MKKTVIIFPLAAVIVVLAVCIFALPGCRTEEFSRYPAVSIPHYTRVNYYTMLSDKNPAIVFNAVCNLGAEASTIAETLSNKEVDKESQDYKISLEIYQKITGLLKSKDPKILAGSLRFLQLFCDSYGSDEELVKPIMKVKARTEQVKYEQILALAEVVGKDTKISTSFINKRLRDKSWLVSRAVYSLVNAVRSKPIRIELIRKYKAEDNEAEKLLILTAFEDDFSSRVFDFLVEEVLSTKSPKIKDQIFDMFPNAKDTNSVINWVNKNYGKFSESDIRNLAYRSAVDLAGDFSSALMVILLKHGYVPADSFFSQLADGISGYTKEEELSDADRKKLDNLLAVKKVVLKNDAFKARLLALEVKESQIDPQLLAEYGAAVDQFIAQTKEILVKYQVDPAKIESCLKDMPMLNEYLIEKMSEQGRPRPK